MKRLRKLVLILVMLIGVLICTGCNIIITAPDCCTPPVSPPAQSCNLEITAGYLVWGGIYGDGQYLGEIDFVTNPTVVVSVPCNAWLTIYIIDSCGYQSHTETIFINPGSNYLYFGYWKNDKQNDFHQRCTS